MELNTVEKWIMQYRDIFGVCGDAETTKLQSSICRPTDVMRLINKWDFAEKIKHLTRDSVMDRKMWEWLYIVQSLHERGMLQQGKRGLGFACGKEPLISVFAAKGANVTATDAPSKEITEEWQKTNQHSYEKNDLFYPSLCDKQSFDRNTEFKRINMRQIPQNLIDFDFVWSSCALEHLGSLHAAKEFIYRSMDCLKPGGIAVHTTEINIRSSVETIMMGIVSALRTVDFIEIAEHLEWQGHKVEPLDFRLDGTEQDNHYVVYGDNHQTPHFKLVFDRLMLTSFGLIITKKLI